MTPLRPGQLVSRATAWRRMAWLIVAVEGTPTGEDGVLMVGLGARPRIARLVRWPNEEYVVEA